MMARHPVADDHPTETADASSSSSSIPAPAAHADDASFTAALFANQLKSYSFDLEALRMWMITFVVCDFNVDVGVEVEYMFPSTELSQHDIQTICYSSFPERSNPETLADSAFHFKFRHSSPAVRYAASVTSDTDSDHWYGFCLFRQQHDVTAKRKFRQKSLILLSQHDFPPLFSHVVRTVSMLEFAVSPALLESACNNIAQWGRPRIGVRELPFLGEILEVHIPPHASFPLQGCAASAQPSGSKLRAEIHTSGPVGSWARLAQLVTSLSELYVVFERALLCEPIVVLADDPRTASEFVSSIVDMIRPIPFGGDCRPFFPMQSDYPGSHDSLPLRNYLIGITNPFFLKRLLSSPQNTKETHNPHVVYLPASEPGAGAAPSNHKRRSLLSYASAPPPDWDYPSSLVPANDTRTFLAKDSNFLRKLDLLLKDPSSSPLDIERYVRRHFALLSALFLAPLNRYLSTLSALEAPHEPPHELPTFSEEEFIASLGKYGCSVRFKGSTAYYRHRTMEGFYRRFCRSPNFYTWLQMKTALQRGGWGSGVMTPGRFEKEEVRGLTEALRESMV